ncbi:hypothetical protein K3152_13480 [Qipengyuania sp. 1NDH17]|uniref:Uncharacterized protein n=1 Tax=Qipengyuania polymorpha TaxID=2867234 RepID=A0ABS7J0B0_9SPHN|nr:hypothetical protein [Qipengyuania polymorpha]MBX7459259.1 hypothetical protein [Qipengyuania polymorpha]
MRPETDEQFTIAARAIATAFLDRFAHMHLSRDEVANISGAALSEILAQQLGPFGAVERLRDLADTLEQQVLKDALDS